MFVELVLHSRCRRRTSISTAHVRNSSAYVQHPHGKGFVEGYTPLATLLDFYRRGFRAVSLHAAMALLRQDHQHDHHRRPC